jgi:hypothetical protein
MKKLVIVTDGSRMRGFRLSDRQHGNNLSFRCTEISPAEAGGEADESTESQLSALARQISELVAQEDAALWNLAAPRDLLTPLLGRLESDAGQRLTRTSACNLINTSLTEIAIRFPPTPCQSARSLRSPSRSRKLATAETA